MKTKRRTFKSWRTVDVDRELSAVVATQLSCSPILADLLVARGVHSPQRAEAFLNPRLADLEDPESLPDIDVAVERIARALGERQRIAVFGDYDVDGLSSTALLFDFFRFLGQPADCRIPNRLDDGYGLSVASVRQLAADGTQLIITVDNGSSAVEAIDCARTLGIDVVVIDHHLPGETLPNATALVNPILPGSRYPFPRLAGVGVTFKVVWAICQHFSRSRKVSPEFRQFMVESLGLVALGTIADVVPLCGENRILARYGLRALAASRRPGIRALVSSALRGAHGSRPPAADDVAFRMAPCLNAAGRLGDAGAAFRLLVTDDDTEAQDLMKRLVRDNKKRRDIERRIFEEAREWINEQVDLDGERVLVLAREGWHPGVIGIVASRVVDEFCRPALLISLSGEKGRGSARSIPQVPICDALEKARDCLERFGGHARAAGVSVATDRVEELRRSLNRAVEVSPGDMVPEVLIDGEYSLSEWTPELLHDLDRLAPFGEGNREPLFALRQAEVVGAPRLMGRDSSHLAFFLRESSPLPRRAMQPAAGSGYAVIRAVAFGKGEYHRDLTADGAVPGGRAASVSVVYQPILNEWQGQQQVELRVRELELQ